MIMKNWICEHKRDQSKSWQKKTRSSEEKAYQLQLSEILLPPEVFLDGGAHRRQTVVGVHDHVNERVERAEEKRC